MTITATVPKNQYIASGSATFVYSFKVSDAADIDVYLNGVLQVSGYTVTGVGDAAGGTVVFTAAPANGAGVLLIRSTTRNQATDWTANDPDPAESKEQAFDKAMSIDQEQDESLARTPQYPVDNATILTPKIDTPVVGSFAQAKDTAGNIGWALPALGTALSNPVALGQGGTGLVATSIGNLLNQLGAARWGAAPIVNPSGGTITIANPLTYNTFAVTTNGAVDHITGTGVAVGTRLIVTWSNGGNVITNQAGGSGQIQLMAAQNYTTVAFDRSFFHWDGTNWIEFYRQPFITTANANKFYRGSGIWDFVMLHETGGPTDLTIAAIAAGQLLQRSGSTIVGVAPRLQTEFISSDQTVTVSTKLTIAHGLGAKPKLVQVVLKNGTAELNYSVGDEVDMSLTPAPLATNVSVSSDTTNIYVIQLASLQIPDKNTFTNTNITPGSWKWVVRAWL